MNRKRISRIGKYVLVTMLLTAVPASGWAQRMIKVSGTVYNIADKKKSKHSVNHVANFVN
ncbi:hypothetical protein [Phocaeicola plebeius]|uniref:hypothetical protein n=1 Tax=Phocaeicola plebeius TaxID=310297 RepID=UPI003FD7ADC4